MNIPDGLVYAIVPTLAAGVGWLIAKIINKTNVNLEQIHLVNQDLYRMIEELKEDNAKCEVEHKKTQIELNEIKKQMGFRAMLRGKVYILDDDQEDLDEFYREFDSISIINYKGYRTSEQFLYDTQRDKPEMVVIDHSLQGRQTAHDVIRLLGYTPEILIMSGNSNFAAEYETMQVKFFTKEGKFVLRIAATIIEYLSKK